MLTVDKWTRVRSSSNLRFASRSSLTHCYSSDCAWAGEKFLACRSRKMCGASNSTRKAGRRRRIMADSVVVSVPVCFLAIISVHKKEFLIASRQTVRKSCSFLYGCIGFSSSRLAPRSLSSQSELACMDINLKPRENSLDERA